MAKHKLQVFLDYINGNEGISVRDRLIFNFIIKLGLSVSEIINLKLYHVNIAQDFFRIIIVNLKKDSSTEIAVERTKESRELYDLINEYYLERRQKEIPIDYMFVTQRGTQLTRSVVIEAFKRYTQGMNIGEYNTNTMRNSILNLLRNYSVGRLRLLEQQELEKVEKEFAKASREEKKPQAQPILEYSLLDRDKEIAQIKSMISATDKSIQDSPNIYFIKAPLGGGKTVLADFASSYAEARDIVLIKNTFFKEQSNFEFFHKIYGNVLEEDDLNIFYEKISRSILKRAQEKNLLMLLEDIHNADQDSIEFLRYFLKTINAKYRKHRLKIIVLLTIDSKEDYRWILERLEYQQFNLFELAGISFDSIPILGRRIFKNRKLSKKMLENIWGLSSGNPHYLTEVLSYIKKNKKEIVRIKQNAIHCSSWDIPEKISAIFKKKILYLENISKRILLILSLLNKPFEKKIVLSIVDKFFRGKIDYSSYINSLKRRKLIEEEADDRLKLSHETLNEAILDLFSERDIEKAREEIAEVFRRYDEDSFLTEASYQIDKLGNFTFDFNPFVRSAKYLQKIGSVRFALQYCSNALEFPNITKDEKSEIKKAQKNIYSQIRQWDKAIKCAADILSLQKDEKEKLIIGQEIGEFYFKKGDLDKALINYAKAREEAVTQKDNLSLAYILERTSDIYNKKANYVEAAKNCRKALEIPQVQEDKKLKVLLSNQLATAYIYLGERLSAEKTLKDALAIIKELGSESLEAISLFKLGLNLFYDKKFSDALKFYEQAKTLANQNFDKRNESFSIMNMGVCHHTNGELDLAIARYEEARQIFDLLENDYEKTNMLVNQSIIFTFVGNFSKAHACAKEALEISKKNNYKLLIPTMEHLIGVIKHSLGDYISADDYFNRSIYNFSELTNVNETCLALFSLAENYLHMNKFKEAKEKTTMALNLGLKNKLKNIEYQGYLLEAQIEIESGTGDPQKIASSLEKLKEIKDYAPIFDIKLKEKWILATYYKITSKEEEAHRLINEIKKETMDYANKLPADFSKTYIKTREKYFNLPPITKIAGEKALLQESIYTQNIYNRFFEILGLANVKKEPQILLTETIKNIIDVKSASCSNLSMLDNGSLQTICSINKEGDKEASLVIPSQVSDYVIDNGIATSSEEFKKGGETTSWQCFPIRSFDDIVGTLFLTYEQKAPELSSSFKIAFKNYLSFMGILVNKMIQDQKISKLSNDKDVFLEKLKLSQEETKDKVITLKPISRIKSKLKRDLKYNYNEIIGESGEIRKVLSLLDKVIDSDISVLITGESGTGKELIARAIHYNNSKRKDFPFLSINCAALPETLLESELFGYKKGAFTGAFNDKEGLFEAADKGTLLLDEIGEMAQTLQSKLLRVLQDGEVRRVGDVTTIKTNVRIIAATNRDLEESVHEGKFRRDLFYRLNAFNVFVPSLRKRKKDIKILVDCFIKKHASGKNIKLEKGIIEAFRKYNWPGNIRELENEVVKLLALAQGNYIGVELLKGDSRFK